MRYRYTNRYGNRAMPLTPEDIAGIDRREGSRHGWLAARDAAAGAWHSSLLSFFDGWREVQRDPDEGLITAAPYELRATVSR
jgi:hypothetical protein